VVLGARVAYIDPSTTILEEKKKREGSCPTPERTNCLKITWEQGPWLGIVTFSKTRFLIVDLCLLLVWEAFKELINSDSSDCFLDSKFMISNKLRTWEIDLLLLTLIDGTVNCYVNQVVSLPIQLSCRSLCMIECYVTTLDSSYELILGYN